MAEKLKDEEVVNEELERLNKSFNEEEIPVNVFAKRAQSGPDGKPIQGGTQAGGMVLVDELPEVGDPSLLYKLPDGTIWSCVNTTETSEWSQVNGGGSSSPSLYLHRLALGNPPECNQVLILINIYTPKATAYTDINELSDYLIAAGINNIHDPISGYGLDNPNGIICTSFNWSGIDRVVTLKSINPTQKDTYVLSIQGIDTEYYGIEILEDAVMPVNPIM